MKIVIIQGLLWNFSRCKVASAKCRHMQYSTITHGNNATSTMLLNIVTQTRDCLALLEARHVSRLETGTWRP
jgi:hypothetical protein